MQQYLLDKEYEFSGEWWLPDTEERYHGILKFNTSGFDLKLNGSFDKSNKISVDSPNKKHPKIYGECQGKYLTLLDAECLRSSVSLFNSVSINEKIKGKFLIVGGLFEKEDFDSMSFYTPDLQAFMCHLVLNKEIQTSPKFKLKYELSKKPKEIINNILSISSDIEIGYFWKESGSDYKKKIIETGAAFTIKPNTLKDINWFLEQRKKVTMWLTFLSGYGMSPLNIDCSVKDEKFDFLVALPDQNYCSVNHPTDFFINKNLIGENFKSLLKSWFNLFEVYPNFRIPCALAFEILAEKVTRAHFVDFLNLMQALEGIHRAFYDGVYMNQEDYDNDVYPVVVKAIPDCVHQNHKASFKKRIEFGNEVSLIKRLNDLANDFDDEIKKILFGVKKKIPRAWVDTRNYFTHRDEKTKEKVLEGAELYEAIVKLRGFLRFTILRLMGVPQKLMIDALSNSSHISRELKQFL